MAEGRRRTLHFILLLCSANGSTSAQSLKSSELKACPTRQISRLSTLSDISGVTTTPLPLATVGRRRSSRIRGRRCRGYSSRRHLGDQQRSNSFPRLNLPLLQSMEHQSC